MPAFALFSGYDHGVGRGVILHVKAQLFPRLGELEEVVAPKVIRREIGNDRAVDPDALRALDGGGGLVCADLQVSGLLFIGFTCLDDHSPACLIVIHGEPGTGTVQQRVRPQVTRNS